MPISTDTIVARRPAALAVFLVLAFGLSWLALLPIIVGAVSPTSTAGTVFLLLVAIGSPGIAGFVVAGLFAGRAGVSVLLRAGGRWRVPEFEALPLPLDDRSRRSRSRSFPGR
jgi:hypothetical protein